MSDLCADQVRAGGGALPITELGVSVYVYLEYSDSVSMASGFSAYNNTNTIQIKTYIAP